MGIVIAFCWSTLGLAEDHVNLHIKNKLDLKQYTLAVSGLRGYYTGGHNSNLWTPIGKVAGNSIAVLPPAQDNKLSITMPAAGFCIGNDPAQQATVQFTVYVVNQNTKEQTELAVLTDKGCLGSIFDLSIKSGSVNTHAPFVITVDSDNNQATIDIKK